MSPAGERDGVRLGLRAPNAISTGTFAVPFALEATVAPESCTEISIHKVDCPCAIGLAVRHVSGINHSALIVDDAEAGLFVVDVIADIDMAI